MRRHRHFDEQAIANTASDTRKDREGRVKETHTLSLSDTAPASARVGLLFVCTGNICRSPTAEGVMRALVRQAGVEPYVILDSAGTHDYHVGEPPDPRTQRAARRRGYDLSALRARQIARPDFYRFDWILAMDRGHLRILERLRPQDARATVTLFTARSQRYPNHEVPDPYYGGAEGFETVLDMIEEAAAQWLEWLRQEALARSA